MRKRHWITFALMFLNFVVMVDITRSQTFKPLKPGVESTSPKILPASYYFPQGKFGDSFICNGTFISDKTPYEPNNPGISYVECSRSEMNCRISTAYISEGSWLNLVSHGYTVEKWTPDLITARFSGDFIYGNYNILVILSFDKSATIFHGDIEAGESYREVLKDAHHSKIQIKGSGGQQ